MIVECEEKSNQAKHPEVVSVGPYDTLYYPNVDSCLSITYVLDGNYMVGGHAGWGADMKPRSNAFRVKAKMDQFVAAAGREVSMVIFAGAFASYSVASLIPARVAPANVRKIDTPGQSNIWIFSSRRWISIETTAGVRLHYGSIDLLPPYLPLF
jgi:hypothetical protein